MSRTISRLSLQSNETPGSVATDQRFHAIDREPHAGVAGVAGVLGNGGIGHALVHQIRGRPDPDSEFSDEFYISEQQPGDRHRKELKVAYRYDRTTRASCWVKTPALLLLARRACPCSA
jgi:hypothetical protein